MKKKKDRKYTMKEVASYYILGYKRYEQNIEQNGLIDILINIIDVSQGNISNKEIRELDIDLLHSINFDWLLSAKDFIAYAVCIFYVLMNREIQITAEKIVNEFLSEVHSHHPRKTIKEAEVILENIF